MSGVPPASGDLGSTRGSSGRAGAPNRDALEEMARGMARSLPGLPHHAVTPSQLASLVIGDRDDVEDSFIAQLIYHVSESPLFYFVQVGMCSLEIMVRQVLDYNGPEAISMWLSMPKEAREALLRTAMAKFSAHVDKTRSDPVSAGPLPFRDYPRGDLLRAFGISAPAHSWLGPVVPNCESSRGRRGAHRSIACGSLCSGLPTFSR